MNRELCSLCGVRAEPCKRHTRGEACPYGAAQAGERTSWRITYTSRHSMAPARWHMVATSAEAALAQFKRLGMHAPRQPVRAVPWVNDPPAVSR